MYLILFSVIVAWLHLSKWGIIGLMLLSSTAFMLYVTISKGQPIGLKFVKAWLRQSVLIVLLVHIFRWLYSFGGFWLDLLAVLVYCGWIIWSRRKAFIVAKHRIETLLFGKPIREYIENGEKPPKLKVKF